MKPPPCVVDRWAGGSLTRRPKGPFAVSWPRQLGVKNVRTILTYVRSRLLLSIVAMDVRPFPEKKRGLDG